MNTRSTSAEATGGIEDAARGGIRARSGGYFLVALALVAGCTEIASGSPPMTFGDPLTVQPPAETSESDPEVIVSPVFVNELEVTTPGAGSVEFAYRGDLPTPCHVLHTELSWSDSDNTIRLDMWSEAPADQVCIQVLQPFSRTARLDDVPTGTYTLVVGGKELGRVDVP